MSTHDPFLGPPPEEVPLERAPLVRVLAQVRFPRILSAEKPAFIAPFQEALRGKYPVLREERVRAILIGPNAVGAPQEEVGWRFSDLKGAWRVSLAPNFLSLETTDYGSRTDFLGRLNEIGGALQEHLQPGSVDRFGVRYIDRVTGSELNDIERLVRIELLGIAAMRFSAPLSHAISETMFKVGAANLHVRWARLPAGVTYDPGAVEPVPEESWVLDLDMFTNPGKPVEPEELGKIAMSFTERTYSFFRWAVTDEFLRRYGGKL